MSSTAIGLAHESYDPDPNLKIWLNGELVTPERAKVSVFDHGLLYGDGVFEGLRSYNGRIFERHAHLTRLFASAKALMLPLPYTPDELDRAINASLEANGLLREDQDAYIRLVATRGVGRLGLSPLHTAWPCVYIIASTIAMYAPEVYEKGMPVIVSSVTRNHPNAMSPRTKSLNYLNNVLAKLEALQAGVTEALMLNHLGFVAEGTGDNIFLVRDGQLQTPPTSAGILEGITRSTVMRLARLAGIEVVEKDLVRHDLYAADECFLTGTGAQIIPVSEIDKRPVGLGAVGPITRQMMTEYATLVRRPPT